MHVGLYWIRVREAATGRYSAFWTIGNCADGELVEPINHNLAGVNVEAVGPFIGTASELTGRTAEYIKDPRRSKTWVPYRRPKPKELTP